jgi:general secretion pathway protein D
MSSGQIFVRMRRWPCALLASALLAACATENVIKEAREYFDGGRGEQALATLDKATRENPDNHALRTEYFHEREVLVARWLGQADALRLGEQPDAAEELYRRAQKYDSANARAKAGLAQIETDYRHRTLVANVEKLVREEKYIEAEDVLRPVLVENPQQRDARRLQRTIEEKTVKPAIATIQLKTTATKPISLELRDVTLRSVFDVLSRASGVNFVFDKDVRSDQKTTIAVRDATVEKLIGLVLATNQLEKKLVDESTLLIFPNTPQKMREYQELVVKSFYLSNADVRQTANMVRTLIKTRDIFIDEKLNMLIVRDTPSAIRLTERLIATQDLAEPEVMLEVEVLEISSNRLLAIGLRFPDSVAYGVAGGGTSTTTTTASGTTTTSGGTPGVLTLPEWLSRNASLVRLTFTDPLFLFTLRQTDGTTNLLANPRIRVKNKEKAKIHIGDRVPVITTTSAVSGGFVSQSVNYLDVGLKLEVEPQIYLEDEVGIKVGLEVSSITNTIQTPGSGTLTYQLGTRNASTVLRLRDGETQILAGLISDEDRRSASRVPGIGELPVVGRLFSSTSDSTTKTEIMLLITPRLVRTLARPDARSVEFAAGTEASSGSPAGVVPQQQIQPPSQAAQPANVQPVAPVESPQPAIIVPGRTMVPFGGVQPDSPR